MTDGNYRCPNSQQGYSPFSTWTRGLAWIMCGYAEELEFLPTLSDEELATFGGRQEIESMMLKAACASWDFYIEHSPTDGIPYWDTGAPGLARLGDYLNRPAEPYNDHEPVDSSAAAIGAQGLLRLGRYLERKGQAAEGRRYFAGGPDRTQNAVRRAVSEHRDGSSGIAPAFGVPSTLTAGIINPSGRKCRAANRACGAITMP